MALNSIAQETRETSSPDQQGRIEFRRTHSLSDGFANAGPLSLVGFSVRAYGDEAGGRATFSPVVNATSQQDTNQNGDPIINIDFTVYTQTARPGTDHIITYEVEDDSGNVGEFELFFQNGVWNPKTDATLLSRLSSEFERLSGTFRDGDFTSRGITDFENFDLWTVPKFDINFISDSSEFTKHTDEAIPYYASGNSASTITAPDQLFDSRDGAIYILLQWDQLPSRDVPVFEVKQGTNVHVQVRNAQRDVSIESDFADGTVYEKATRADDFVLAELGIDTAAGEAEGAVNREFDRGKVGLTGTFQNADTEIVLDPEDVGLDVKLFEFLAFPQAQDHEFSNKVASMISYLYDVDMTESERLDITTYIGSPDISNHLFYDSRTDALDAFIGFSGSGTPRFRKIDPDGNQVWTYGSGDAIDSVSDNVGYAFLADADENGVVKLTKSGERIWSFPDSDPGITSGLQAINSVTLTTDDVAVAAFGNDVYGVGLSGLQSWLFGASSDRVTTVAATSGGRVYAGTESPDPEVILLDSDGNEINRFTDHLNDVSALVGDSEGFAYSGAVNGEVRFSNDSGDQTEKLVNIHDDSINALDVDEDYLYTASDDRKAKKIELSTTNEIWTLDYEDATFIENQIDAIDSNDINKPDPGDVILAPIDITAEPGGDVYVIIEDQNDEIENHLFKVDSSKNVLRVEVYGDSSSVSVQPGPEASQWT